MVNFVRKNLKYFLLFIVIFCIYQFFGFFTLQGDVINSYGFSHAIRMGEIPYKDFNTITTPLYAFVMALPLFLYDNFIMFILFQSLIVSFCFYLLDQIYGSKSIFVFLALIFLVFFGLLPTYNFFLFFLIVLLVYMEKNYSNHDYLIGFIIGLSILTKHTIGLFLILPSVIVYIKKYDKLFKRFVGLFIPCFIFLFYLVFTNSIYQFFDLCVFGLFDFGKNNFEYKNIFFIFSIILLVISLYVCFRNKKNICNYYLIFSFGFVFPLFDINHFSLYLACFVMILLPYLHTKNFKYYYKLTWLISVLVIFYYFIYGLSLGPVYQTHFTKFKYNLNVKELYQNYIDLEKINKIYGDSIIISNKKMFYDINFNKKIDYYNIFLYGNHGFNGTNKMINNLRFDRRKYLIVDFQDYNNSSKRNQFNKEIVNYIIKNYKPVYSYKYFIVYEK